MLVGQNLLELMIDAKTKLESIQGLPNYGPFYRVMTPNEYRLHKSQGEIIDGRHFGNEVRITAEKWPSAPLTVAEFEARHAGS